MKLSIDERINLAETIVRDIQAAQEIVLVRDEGCLINNDREFQPWFDEILRRETNIYNFRKIPAPSRNHSGKALCFFLVCAGIDLPGTTWIIPAPCRV